MNAKRLAIVTVAIALVTAVILIAAISLQDGRTRSEKLILAAGDLTGMNATQMKDPFPNSYHPDARPGSEAAGSSFW
jgi:hypothetical protein